MFVCLFVCVCFLTSRINHCDIYTLCSNFGLLSDSALDSFELLNHSDYFFLNDIASIF